MRRLLLIALLLSGCAAQRFSNRAILWKDTDDKPVPMPRPYDPPFHWVAIRDALFLPADRLIRFDYGREATNVNAVDETPDSTWFTNRWHSSDSPLPHHLSDEEVRNGAFGDRPRPVLPLTVTKGKDRGGNLGFVVKDALGRQFAIKIDPPGLVGMDTATEVVVSRLAWAAGWNVPAESLVHLRLGDLILSPKASTIDEDGHKIPLGQEKFRSILAKAPLDADGTIQALASLWIEGDVIGAYAYYGRRHDDKNDRVKHEDRRDLRGYGVFCAWVNNIDTTEANTLDSYIGDKGKGHVIHWQQDVGGSFGSRAQLPMEYWMGFDTYLSIDRILASFLTLGIYRYQWDGEAMAARRAREVAQYPEIGWFDADDFDPRRWRAIFDNPAFVRATKRDLYWGAKRVLQLDARELRVAISEGHYRTAAAERLFDIMWRRRTAVARAYLEKVPTSDYFRVEGGSLCWDDTWIDAGLGEAATTSYRADGQLVPAGAARCVKLPPPPATRGYHIVKVQSQRSGERKLGPAVRVHLMADATAGEPWHIVGLER